MTTPHHTMAPIERVQAALVGEHVDRVPFCFWHHFKPEGSGTRMAELTMEFFREKFEDFPLILTIFSPLTQIFRFIGKTQAIAHARENPVAFEQGLATLATNLRLLASAAIEAGASGIFFSSMGATNIDFTPLEYARFGRPYDLQVLESTKAGWLNIIHAHADPAQEDDEIYFENFIDYPVQVMSWSDRITGPSLSEALSMTDKCLMGGLAERGPLTHGGETEIENEIMAAVTQTKGRRLILANGCSVPDDTPEEWLHVARKLVDQLK